MIETVDFQELLRQFRLEDAQYAIASAQEITIGHINSTYLVRTEHAGVSRGYILQKINTYVFKQPQDLMENIMQVTGYLKERIAAGEARGQTTLTVYPGQDGGCCVTWKGDCWRCYNYVENTFCLQTAGEDEAYLAAKGFGAFQRLLDGFPIAKLHETIPDFHHTPKRYEALEAAIAGDSVGRRDSAAAEIAFARARQEDCARLTALLEAGEIPLRVTHNDTKLNNVLFDNGTREPVCVVDLDTIMPGLSLYDYGDSLRFLGNAAAEDERDLRRVAFRMPLFRAYTRGYLEAAAGTLCSAELRMLPFSIKLMTYECGMRFLTDYLNGDVYFRIHRPDDNLARCRTQFRLVEHIEAHMAEMEAFVQGLAGA